MIASSPATPSIATQRSILLLSFATFSSMATQRVCDAMLPELSRVFAVGLSEAAQVVSVFAIVYGALQLFYGWLGDRLGKFRVIAWATLACSVGNLLAVFAHTLDMLVLSRALVAVGAAAIIPLGLAWVGDVADPARLQETIARVGLGTTLGVGSGQLVGGLLTDTLGWRWAFGLLALLFCSVAVMLLADLRRQQVAQRAHAAANAPVSPSSPMSTRTGFAAQLAGILAMPWARVVLLVGVVEGAAGFGALPIWASHLYRDLGFTLSAAGAIVALFGVGGVLYMAVAHHLIRRLRPVRLVVMGGSLILLASLVMGQVPSSYRAFTVPASLLAGFGFFAFHNVMQANATQMAPGARGLAVSLFATSLFLGQSMGVLLATGLSERLGAGLVIVLAGASMGGLGLWFAWALRVREARA